MARVRTLGVCLFWLIWVERNVFLVTSNQQLAISIMNTKTSRMTYFVSLELDGIVRHTSR